METLKLRLGLKTKFVCGIESSSNRPYVEVDMYVKCVKHSKVGLRRLSHKYVSYVK